MTLEGIEKILLSGEPYELTLLFMEYKNRQVLSEVLRGLRIVVPRYLKRIEELEAKVEVAEMVYDSLINESDHHVRVAMDTLGAALGYEKEGDK